MDIRRIGSGQGGSAATPRPASVAPVAPVQRALVPLERPEPACAAQGHSARPASPFLAHLMAMATQAPQTRALRRALPSDALTAYAAAGRTAPGAAPALSRLA